MTSSDPHPTSTTTLPEELNVFYRSARPAIITVLARAGPERLALTTSVLRSMTCPGVVVATRGDARAYERFFETLTPPLPAPWTVLEGGNSEGGVRAIARALAHARELLRGPNLEEELSALWLPPHVVEAFGLLPADGSGLVLLDSWDGLLQEYIPADGDGSEAWPQADQLEEILARTLRKYAQALLVVIVDSSSHSRITDLADGVVEVVAREQFGGLSGSVLVTRKSEGAPVRASLRFHVESGALRWHIEP